MFQKHDKEVNRFNGTIFGHQLISRHVSQIIKLCKKYSRKIFQTNQEVDKNDYEDQSHKEGGDHMNDYEDQAHKEGREDEKVAPRSKTEDEGSNCSC